MLQRLIISKPKDESNYFFSGIITCRDISFHVNTSILVGQNGFSHKIVVLYNNTIFRFSLTKWKYTGGGSGKSPTIVSGDYQLQIQTGLSWVDFKEKYKENYFNNYEPFCSVFEISSARGNYETNIKKEEKVLILEVKPENTLEKELYKYHNHKVDIESLAYYDDERLVVDYWKLYDNYESEEFISIAKNGIEILNKYFYASDKTQLLWKIHETCSGSNSLEKFEMLLIKLEV